MEQLNSAITKLTIPATAMTAANAITILDTADFTDPTTFKACVVNAVMVANRDTVKDIVFHVSLVRGAVEAAIAHNQMVSAGQTWTSRPEGFLNMQRGDKLVIWFDTAVSTGAICDSIVSYLHSAED